NGVAILADGGGAFGTGDGGAGAPVSISAGGGITVGTTSGTFINYDGIGSRGGNAATGNGGNGAPITIQGASVTTGSNLFSFGGEAVLGTLGSTSGGRGGNAGAVSIIATSGSISIGTSEDTFSNALSSGTSFTSIVARGGDTDGTAGGGSGATVFLSSPSGSI